MYKPADRINQLQPLSSGFCTMKRLEALPPDGVLVHHRVPNMKQLAVLLLLPGWDASPSQDAQYTK